MQRISDLALWLLWRERCVLLLHTLLLGLLALGEVLVAELGQESFPVLHPQLRVFGQLPFDHQRLMIPTINRMWKGVVGSGWNKSCENVTLWQ